ncbi:LOW QUALITY PROTEIN: uroporphyrinogen-III synthase [Naumannella halotolerans]|uniref:Uroporphyrinogen-III synthase n=1 Tax=Naumannella halotolerans TaxID=993414 RepID=A0A4R7JC95_9ACTN|nr:LOW QUALITY PROTEIN: uroporphyrinogen-III synthase [Naumannella halotolerans]
MSGTPGPGTCDRPGRTSSTGFAPDQLRGFRIGVTADRRAEDLIAAFERRGAEVLHAPTIRMTDVADDGEVLASTEEVIAAAPDHLLATTSYGMRRWFEVADAAGLGEPLLTCLSSSRILVRGPKARGAVRAAGLDDHGMSERETTASLIDLVCREDLRGSTVAVQLHGDSGAVELQRLRYAGARVVTVAPYFWRTRQDDTRVQRLVEAICGGGLDAVTFTSPPAVHALLEAADDVARRDELLAAMRSTVTPAVVGPVTAAPLIEAGVEPIMPERFRMGALIRLVCENLSERRVIRLSTSAGTVELRGRLVIQDTGTVELTPTSLALFRTLMEAGGSTVSRATLAESLPGENEDHAVDVAISRLRQCLPDPSVLATVIKRGYRIDVSGCDPDLPRCRDVSPRSSRNSLDR